MLIDLFVPFHLASLKELQALAKKAGLDGLIVALEDLKDLPSKEDYQALSLASPSVFFSLLLEGPGYRFACLFRAPPHGLEGPPKEARTAHDVLAWVKSKRGLALPVAPRRARDKSVSMGPPQLDPHRATGVVAMTEPGSFLGRDLDMEDAAVSGRRILGGSGPFAKEIGHYASFLSLPSWALEDASSEELYEVLILALSRGKGIAIEQGFPENDPSARTRHFCKGLARST